MNVHYECVNGHLGGSILPLLTQQFFIFRGEGVLISVILMRYASYILAQTCTSPNPSYLGTYI